MNSEQDFLDALWEMVAQSVGVPAEQLRARERAKAHLRLARARRHNDAYYEALARVTPKQAQTIADLRAKGARVWTKLRQNRMSGNVCIFLSRQVFDATKYRLATKIYAVYPDGTRTETFERSISVRPEF